MPGSATVPARLGLGRCCSCCAQREGSLRWFRATSGNTSQTVGVERPETRYVDVGGAEVAYLIVGQGPPDVVYVLGFSQVDLRWEDEVFAGFQERLASFSRLILVDRRGTGASTPSPTRPCRRGRSGPTTCEPCSTPPEQAAVLAETDGGPTGLPFTATQPDRVSGLILANSTARRLRADDYPSASPQKRWTTSWRRTGPHGEAPIRWQPFFPSRADDPELGDWVAMISRAIATPKNGAAQTRYVIESIDATEALPRIEVPTLVLHSTDNLVYSIEEGRYLADHIKKVRGSWSYRAVTLTSAPQPPRWRRSSSS
jgi:pimeloyl-ACP methyl ester carboxylesterase